MFGENGTTLASQRFDLYFKDIRLHWSDTLPFELPDQDSTGRSWQEYDPQELIDENYKRQLERLFEEAIIVKSLDEDLPRYSNASGLVLVIYYHAGNRYDMIWTDIAEYFGLWPVIPPRGVYRGVIRFKWEENQILLVGSYSPFATKFMPRPPSFRPFFPHHFRNNRPGYQPKHCIHRLWLSIFLKCCWMASGARAG